MVDPALQSAIEAMSLDERLDLVEYIESTVDQSRIEVTEEQKAVIRSRAAELLAVDRPDVGGARRSDRFALDVGEPAATAAVLLCTQ
jgi:hypothetical protein